MRVPARGDAADLLARPDGALLQGLGSLQLALAAVQGPQVPQGGVHRRAGRRKKTKEKKSQRTTKVLQNIFKYFKIIIIYLQHIKTCSVMNE